MSPVSAMLLSSFLLTMILFILIIILTSRIPMKAKNSSKRVKDDIRKIKEQVSHGY